MMKGTRSPSFHFPLSWLFISYILFQSSEVGAFVSPTITHQSKLFGIGKSISSHENYVHTKSSSQSLASIYSLNSERNSKRSMALHKFGQSRNLKLYAGGGEDLDIRDRVGSALVYVLPVLDGINYGHFLFSYFPEISRPIFSLINPILAVYKANTFIPLFCYLALIYVGRNSDLPRFTRFNIQQAVVLDVAIVLPGIILALLENAPLYVQEPISNLFFFCLIASVGYSWISIARGVRPNEIPIISQAAEMSVGPF